MPVTDTTPNASNLYKGSGIAYFMRTGETAYRDLGYCELIDLTPAVAKTEVYAARGGKRQKITTFVDQTNMTFGLTLLEWTPSNLAMALGGTKAAAVNLTATADTNTSTTLSNISPTTNLVKGRRYSVSGTGIPAGDTGIFDGVSTILLDVAATATAVGVSVTITAPVSFGVFDESQVLGQFKFEGDNEVGGKLTIEALNCTLSPNGTLELLNSGATAPGQIKFTVDVYLDTYGNTAQVYNESFPT